MGWTPEQVLSLAPDASAAKAGRDLANPRKWQSIARSEGAVWGECKGSAAEPYRTAIDLAEPAFKCSCPSRKFPCKHALGLFLLFAGDIASASVGAAPPWVEEWLQARARRAEKAQRTEPPAAAADPGQLAAEQEKRAARRSARVQEGVGELELWLSDLIRAGLSELSSRKRDFWSQPAQRMVDAQAPGLARMLEQMAPIAFSGSGWPDRMLSRIGRLSLLLHGHRRLSDLPEDVQLVVRTAIGFTEAKQEVLAQDKVDDRWLVLARSVRVEERLRTQRTWLRGVKSGRSALVLDFAAGQQPLDASLVPGTAFEGALAFYRGAPLRALVADHSPAESLAGWAGCSTVDLALEECAQHLAVDPWIEILPCALLSVTPVRDGDSWQIADRDGVRLPLDRSSDGWTLLAMSGGRPIDLFGEWDGERLVPLSAWADGYCRPFKVGQ